MDGEGNIETWVQFEDLFWKVTMYHLQLSQNGRCRNSLRKFSQVYYVCTELSCANHVFPVNKAAWMPTVKPDSDPLTVGFIHDLAFMSSWLWEGGKKVWTKLKGVLLFTMHRIAEESLSIF